ncbi:MAG: ankyrin repeat domain-containing protein [Acidobacteriia bacterium]|nr:ankyrin repeat domain-containing protein [Terriglobia bacterium]
MPTELPPNPNLEHLKKQAKALLRDFRLKDPAAVARFTDLQLRAAPKLSDAQHVIAREYGFAAWPQLKDRVELLAAGIPEAVGLVRQALRDDDREALRRVFDRYPILKTKINEPLGDFDSPLITQARSGPVLDLLLDAGADINARSRWWAGGFGLLDSASPDLAAHAIRRGAVVTVHAAARLGMLEKLRDLIGADPELVHARGGDGQTPLHFASTVEIASYLVDRGANLDARDVDHDSTPAQYMVRTRPDIARYLISRGTQTDLLMAAALGDLGLAHKLLDADPECIRMRVSEEFFPMVGGSNGGTIYQWELGWHVSACLVARKFGHSRLFDYLMGRSPAEEKLLNACWLHDEAMGNSLLAQNPDLAAALPAAGRRHVAHAARNNDTIAVRLMLAAGLPMDTFSQHHATPLHWAAFHGNLEMVRLLLARHPPIENADNDYKTTPLAWAVFGSRNGWHAESGDYVAAVEALLEAGALIPRNEEGTEAVMAIFRTHGKR